MNNIVKYLANGQMVLVVHTTENGEYIVQKYYETEGTYEDPPYTILDETLCVVSDVFDEPPTEKFDAKIKALDETYKKLLDEVSGKRKELEDIQRERMKLDALAKEVPALAMVRLFHEKKITHFVVASDYGVPAIQTFDDAIVERSSYGRERGMKLLSLFGDSKGVYTYKVNRYSDGSGDWTDVIPCTSLEEAEAKIRDIIGKRLQNDRYKYDERHIAEADKHGVPVPEEVREETKRRKRESLQKQIETSERGLSTLKHALALLEGGNQ